MKDRFTRNVYWLLIEWSFCSYFASIFFSLPCVTPSGIYVFDIMDTYGGGVAVLWVSIFETIAVMWIYGVQNFADDLDFMLKTKISWYWKVKYMLWKVRV